MVALINMGRSNTRGFVYDIIREYNRFYLDKTMHIAYNVVILKIIKQPNYVQFFYIDGDSISYGTIHFNWCKNNKLKDSVMPYTNINYITGNSYRNNYSGDIYNEAFLFNNDIYIIDVNRFAKVNDNPDYKLDNTNKNFKVLDNL